MKNRWLISMFYLSTALSLTGCYSKYVYVHDEPELPPVSQEEMCQYSWSIDAPFYRYDGLTVSNWSRADFLSKEDVRQNINQQLSNCQAKPGSQKKPAVATAFYLQYVDKFERQLFMIPNVAVFSLSLGVLPLMLTDYFAVCIEISDGHGGKRSAMAKGSVNSSVNLWELVFPSEYAGARRQLKKRAVLWNHLTEQAWQVLWIKDHPSNKLSGECSGTLDAMTY